jgi:hypothetical protein
MNQLKEVETHHIQDSTKIQAYMNCPRKYFFEYVLGWKSEIPNKHLIFGSAWHLAMEILLEYGYDAETLLAAYEAFLTEYRKEFSSEWDDINSPKNPEAVFRALPQYASRWADDNFEVLHIEVAGSVAIGVDKIIHFKTDTICHSDEGYFSLEHKTGTRFSSVWAAEWRQKMQVGVYTHVLFCLFPENEIYGVKINGAFLSSPPKIKKDGTPYANARDNEFHRVPIRRNLASMEAWLVEVNMWYDRIQDDFQKLSEASEDDSILEAFPRQTEACTKYGVCPFLDHCSIWHNPLQHAGAPPTGYHVEHWDPRNIPTAREKMTL